MPLFQAYHPDPPRQRFWTRRFDLTAAEIRAPARPRSGPCHRDEVPEQPLLASTLDKTEGVGFEPTSALRRQQFSRLPRSTTPAPLRGFSKRNPSFPDSRGNGWGNETKSETAGQGSAELKSAAVEVASQEPQRTTSGSMERPRRRCQINELRIRRLLLVGAGVSLPGRRQKEQRKAVGDVALDRAWRSLSPAKGQAGDSTGRTRCELRMSPVAAFRSATPGSS
jgi:hypothetical protein